LKPKERAMVELRRRFHARVTSNTDFAANLSEMIIQHLQSVRLESGELNVKFARFPAKRGAPAGDGNRLSHGGRTREMTNFESTSANTSKTGQPSFPP
jgi:hypothetical protein